MRDPHRAFIVAMFVDLTDFRSFAETAEPELLFTTLQQYQSLVGATVDRAGGQIIDYAGDTILSVFNDRVSLSDPELTAVSTALDLRERFLGLAARWAREGTHLGIKIGLDAGHATLGRIGYEGHWAYGAIGRVVVNAALVNRRARSGQILVSERLVETIGKRLLTRESGEVTDPNLRKPVRIVEIVGLGVPA